MLFSCNTTIANIARVTAANRYGEPKRKVVAVNLLAYFSPTSSVTRTKEGDFSQIDATIYLHYEIKQQDQITLKNGDIYYVYSVDTSLDISGEVDHYMGRLTKEL